MLKLRNIFLFTLTFLILGSSLALASPTIHVVDVQRVISESKYGKQARNKVEAENKENVPKLKKLEKDLLTLRGQLQKQSSILSAAAKEEKMLQLRKREKELARAIADQKEKIAVIHNRHVESIVKHVDIVLKELSDSGKYTFILERDPSFVFYASEQIDITDEVVSLLDKRNISM